MHKDVNRRTFLKGAAASAAAVAPAGAYAAKPSSADTPPQVVRKPTAPSGLSQKGLNRMNGVMTTYVDNGDVPGMVTLVSRRGEVDVNAIGGKKMGENNPMQRDTIFR